jgi:hypothetical protein
MPITAETLKKYKRGDIFVETGCLLGDGVQAALDAGFSKVITVELVPSCAARARTRFEGLPVTVVEGDTVAVLPTVLAELGEPATIWLDAHPGDSSPVLEELAAIAKHPIKTHTILIDDRRLMGTDWPNVSERQVHDALRKVNPEYLLSYADGFVMFDIIVAQDAEVTPPLARYERNLTSQGGEDGVISHLLSMVGEGARVAVEFGAADGCWLSNTHSLEQRGWKRHLFDGDTRGNPQVHQAVLTAENIDEVFDAAGVPPVIDVLSVDVDGNDFWLLAALKRKARIVLVEYNASLPVDEPITMKYNPAHRWDQTNYFGANLRALQMLMRAKGLRLVHYTQFNGIFVDESESVRAGLPEASLPTRPHSQGHPSCGESREWVRPEFPTESSEAQPRTCSST